VDLKSSNHRWDAIDSDPAHLLLVAEADSEVAGTLQLSFIPGLARRGSLRGQIEAVRVHPAMRWLALGTAMLTWTIEEARRRGCTLVQLTTDKRRGDAHRVYERLSFVSTPVGMKLVLDP
jgi:GNAT superfamily N-acetyltransferase